MAASLDLPRLSRRTLTTSPAPIRIVHLGLGAFHRAHQAFYTDQVDDRGEWGIAAFTGRTAHAAQVLAQQDGLYTLVTRSGSGDSMSTITSIVEAVDGADLARLVELVAAPATAVITLTVTEAAYRVRDGMLDLDVDVAADLAVAARYLDSQARAPAAIDLATIGLTTVLARLTVALAARRAAHSGPVAVVPCDNLADNAGVLRAGLLGFASLAEPDRGLVAWLEENVSFVGTCVDRITPAATPADIAEVTRTRGYRDECPVITESYHEWVLCGDFPAGRPEWERAGALFVADITPYDTRKLWFLNGAHSLMAYLGQLRGLSTVAEAIADPQCRSAVESFWDLAQAQFDEGSLELGAYRAHLLARFENHNIHHRLDQIAIEGSIKLRQRVVPLLLSSQRRQSESDSELDRDPALLVIASWMDYLAALPEVTAERDSAAPAIAAALAMDAGGQTRALLALLEPRWGEDERLVDAVRALRQPLSSRSTP